MRWDKQLTSATNEGESITSTDDERYGVDAPWGKKAASITEYLIWWMTWLVRSCVRNCQIMHSVKKSTSARENCHGGLSKRY